MTKLHTTKEAAKRLKVTPGRIRAMIRDGILKAQKVGRDWVISSKSLDAVKLRKPGRPRLDAVL